jgi:NAD(P)H-flavin reductase
VPVPYFLLFLCFRKVTQKIFSELDETKAKVSIFPDTRRSPKQRWRGARGWPHHAMARVTPRPHRAMLWAPGPPPDIALPPIYSPQ